jgi:hypothetical protein
MRTDAIEVKLKSLETQMGILRAEIQRGVKRGGGLKRLKGAFRGRLRLSEGEIRAAEIRYRP